MALSKRMEFGISLMMLFVQCVYPGEKRSR